MSGSDPFLYAWCDEGERADAFAAALSALVHPAWHCSVDFSSLKRPMSEYVQKSDLNVEELVRFVRANFDTGARFWTSFGVKLLSGRGTSFRLYCYGDVYRQWRRPDAPMNAGSDQECVYGYQMDVVFPRSGRSMSAEAAVLCMRVQEDTEDMFLRLCAPNEHRRISTGGLSNGSWFSPLELSGTYHAHAHEIARDVALSWIHVLDGDRIECAAGVSLEALAARVEAAPPGSSVGVAPNARRRNEHARLDWEANKLRGKRAVELGLPREGPRPLLHGDEPLTREQVLAVLNTPHTDLLDALEAAAVPDDDWKNIQPLALEMIEAKNQGAPTLEVDVTTGHHVRFIEQHAPYHVRRLPNGGVLLATHPYRTLWQLWADALLLLGIRT